LQYSDTFNESGSIWDYIQNGSIWINHIWSICFWPKTQNESNNRLRYGSNKALLLNTEQSGGVIVIVLYLNGVLHETIFAFHSETRVIYVERHYFRSICHWFVCVSNKFITVSEFWQCPKIPMSIPFFMWCRHKMWSCVSGFVVQRLEAFFSLHKHKQTCFVVVSYTYTDNITSYSKCL